MKDIRCIHEYKERKEKGMAAILSLLDGMIFNLSIIAMNNDYNRVIKNI